MSQQDSGLIHESGQRQVHIGRRELRAGGVPVAIGAREFEIIEVLVESANELVTKNDLMDRIWPGAAVGENTLQVHISAIRKALGRDRAPLKTASGRSYRLLGDWTARRHDASTAPIGLPRIRLTGEAAGTNFPVTVTRLVGRSTAVRQSQDLISAWRILTLTGPGRSDGPRAGRLVLGAPDRAEPRASAADQGRRDEARLILRPLYDRFIERFEAADLRTACAIPDAPPS